METNETSDDKSAVAQLDFDSRTSKRVTWEAWEFTVIGPHQIEVVNASYGSEKADHTYTVGIEDRDGVAVPSECNCPADLHREPDCKHRVALAAIGGPTVLDAALAFESPARETEPKSDTETAADKLRADGGCDCDQWDLPCFECFDSGRRELPE